TVADGAHPLRGVRALLAADQAQRPVHGAADPLGLAVGVDEQRPGPHPLGGPARSLEALGPQPVALALAGGVDVVRAVGVDRQQHPAGHVRVAERQLDPVAGEPEVALDDDPEAEEPVGEVLHQGVGLEAPRAARLLGRRRGVLLRCGRRGGLVLGGLRSVLVGLLGVGRGLRDLVLAVRPSSAGSALSAEPAERRAIAASIAASRSSSDISWAVSTAGSSSGGVAAAGARTASCGSGGAISSRLPVSAATCGTTGTSGPPWST